MQIIIGSELNLIQDQINEILKEKDSQKVEKIIHRDGFDDISDRVLQEDVFGEKILFLIENASFLTLKNSKNDHLLNSLLNSQHDIVCIYHSNKKPNLVYKFNPKKDKVYIKNGFLDKDKINLVNQLILINKLKFPSLQKQEEFIKALPLDPIFIKNEFFKLSTFAHQSIINDQVIDHLIENYHENNIFNLIEQKILKNYKEVLKNFENIIRNKVDPMEILMITATQLFRFKLFKIAEHMNLSYQAITQSLSIPVFIQTKLSKLLKNISINNLSELINDLSLIDYNIKHYGYDPYFCLKLFFLSN